MLDNNLLKFVLLLTAVSILAYMFSQQGVIHNEGSLVFPDTDMVVNPQVDDMLNEPDVVTAVPRKQVRFHNVPEYSDGNITTQNKSVMPPPQPSNNYAPLNSLGTRPQVIDTFQSRCSNGVGCLPKDTVTSADLLPREDPLSMWSQVSPDTPGRLSDMNFLEAGHHVGINTVGSSHRNANYQIRSDPPIAQLPVGPWHQSTIEADINRRLLEVGSDY